MNLTSTSGQSAPLSTKWQNLSFKMTFKGHVQTHTHTFAFVCIDTFTPPLAVKRTLLWETLFKKQDGLKETQRSLVDVASLPLSLSLCLCLSTPAHTVLVLYKPYYCRHQPPLHPHFHLYPIFHIISMLILVQNKARSHVMSFVVMQLVYLATQGENRGGRPRGFGSPPSKLPLLHQRPNTFTPGLFGTLTTQFGVEKLTTSIFFRCFFLPGFVVFS